MIRRSILFNCGHGPYPLFHLKLGCSFIFLTLDDGYSMPHTSAVHISTGNYLFILLYPKIQYTIIIFKK